MRFYLRCNGSGRGECGEVFDNINIAALHACEGDDNGRGDMTVDVEDRPDYTIVTEEEAF